MPIIAAFLDAPALTDFLSNVTQIVTSVSQMVGTWVSVAVGQPLILMAMLMPLVFIGIRALRLLLGQNV